MGGSARTGTCTPAQPPAPAPTLSGSWATMLRLDTGSLEEECSMMLPLKLFWALVEKSQLGREQR